VDAGPDEDLVSSEARHKERPEGDQHAAISGGRRELQQGNHAGVLPAHPVPQFMSRLRAST